MNTKYPTTTFNNQLDREFFLNLKSDYENGNKAAIFEAFSECACNALLHQDDCTRKYGLDGVVVPVWIIKELQEILIQNLQSNRSYYVGWKNKYLKDIKRLRRYEEVKFLRRYSNLKESLKASYDEQGKEVSFIRKNGKPYMVLDGAEHELPAPVKWELVYEQASINLERKYGEKISPKTIKEDYMKIKKLLKTEPWRFEQYQNAMPDLTRNGLVTIKAGFNNRF